MNIKDIRRANLHKALEKLHPEPIGRLKFFAQQVGISQQYSSSIAGKRPNKNIGDSMAKRIENALNLPGGWLDVADNLDEVKEASKAYRAQTQAREFPELIDTSSVKRWLKGDTPENVIFRRMPIFIGIKTPPSTKAFIYSEQTSAMPPFAQGDIYLIDPAAKASSRTMTAYNVDGRIVVGTLEEGVRGLRLTFTNGREDPLNVESEDYIGTVYAGFFRAQMGW